MKTLNKQLLDAMKISDFNEMKGLYHRMTTEAYEAKKPFKHFQEEAYRCALLNYKQSEVVSKVEVLSAGPGNACEECHKENGKQFSIEEALKSMPLPCRDCSFAWPDRDPGYCRCTYLPIVND